MPIAISTRGSTILIRRDAFESARLDRPSIDSRYNLTEDEFRVEENVVAIGPLPSDNELQSLVDELEAKGLKFFDDFFELSGNWPEWLQMFVRSAASAAR
jgi:hypothetical protein